VFAFISDRDCWSAWLTSDGNQRTGPARLEITEVIRPDRVTIHTEVERPFNAFTLAAAGDATLVTWTWDASIPAYVVKLMSLVVGAERMFGGHFEATLARLKSVIEASVT
jgi:hypothetical protein